MITTFTPVEALLGGSLIGIAAVALMAVHGRVAGMTGILTGAILPKGDWDWRVAFLVGAIAAPVVITLLTGVALPLQADLPSWAIVLGGLLVVPLGLIRAMQGKPMPVASGPTDTQASAARARAVIMEIERGLGFEPTDREFEKLPGSDVSAVVIFWPEQGDRATDAREFAWTFKVS